MTTTNFSAGTVVASTWLNDVDAAVYENTKAYSISVFEYLSAAEITSVQAYDYLVDVSIPVQAAINAAWISAKKLIFPPGGYLVNSLNISETGAQAGRVLWMEGSGIGNPFTVDTANGTVLKSNINDPVFSVYTSAVSTSTGTLRISGFSFIGNTTTAVVFLESFYGTSEFCNNVVYQAGTGNGLQVEVMATGSIHDCYFLNRDMVTFGLGASRVGIGLFLNQLYDAGLQTIYKCSSRGWLTAYKIGAGGPSTTYTYNAAIYHSECSVNYNGVHLTTNARGTRIDNIYCEGGEGGVALWDEGDYNIISRCFTFSGYSTHLKSTEFTYGNVYDSNTLSAGTEANQVLIDITSSSVNGGPGKTCINNHLSFGGSGGSLAGVVGLRINGTDPRIHMSGNNFFPRDVWVGGAGTLKTNDLSAASDTTVGSGLYGFVTANSRTKSLSVPQVSRGAVNLAVEPDVLDNTDVASGVLTLGELSVYTFTPTSNLAITEFAAPNLPDKTFSIHVTATAYTVTFTHGTKLKLTSSGNIVTGANGAWLTFQVKPGGVAWLTSHVAY